MKLRNIIIALGAVVAFTACSKDDNDLENTPARLTVKVVAKSTVTKADLNELTGEANINTLTALVFNPTTGARAGALVLNPKVSHEYTMSNIPAPLGVAHVVLIANAPSTVATVTTYAELQALLADLATQTQDNLTMSTPLLTTRALVEGVNDLGEVILTRLPARIQVGKVSTNFTKPLLRGRRVMVTDVYIENAKSKSSFFSVGDWGKVEVSGNFTTLTKSAFTNFTPISDLGYKAYVMENLGAESGKTTLVVEATLEENGQLPPLKGIFRAVINANGKQKGADHNYVKRNYVYDLGLTFSDTSFDPNSPQPPTPEPTEGTLDVQVTVVGWGIVDQTPVVGEE